MKSFVADFITLRNSVRALKYCFAPLLGISIASADTYLDHLTQEEAAQALGWVNKPGLNICNGYYIEPDLHAPLKSENNKPEEQVTRISMDTTNLHAEGISSLTGHVVLSQPGRLIESQKAFFDRDPQTKQIKTIDFYGHVVAREPSKVTVGDHLHLLLQKNQAFYDRVIYRLSLPTSLTPLRKEDDGNNQVHGLIAQGQAQRIDQSKKNQYIFKDANYSTCSPEQTSWHLHAKKITLDKNTGRGNAKSVVVYIKSIPVAYVPVLSFPIDNQRYSGLLSPTFGSNSEGGDYISVPYYWNIAPNYDMTITPTIYSKRGLLLSTKNRFLTSINSGDLTLGILPNDLAFSSFKNSAPGEYATNSNSYIAPELSRLEESSSRRWYTSLKDIANFSQHLQGKVDYTYASDDYLQQDIHLPSIMNSQLLQQASLSYSAPYWQSSILLQQYQTLHPITLLQNSNQYERLPDLTFNLNYPATSNFNYLLSGEGVNFNRLLNPGESFPSSNGQPTSGVRTNVQPGISMSLANSYAYFRPTAQWSLTQYNLANPSYNYPNNITRSLPIINIDSGLYFDRNSSFFGQDYHQTLEPRLFYLYVPYKDQYQIPVFDTNIQSFTFDQLFQTNRFNGTDRIGDANQLSFALTSRLLSSASGEEKSKFGIGRIYYADTPRKVQLCNQYGCQDSQTNVGAISSTERLSPYVGFFNYALSNNWSFRSNAAWDPMTHETNNASAGFQFMPATNHIVNFSYNYVEYGDTYSPQTTLPTDPKNNLNQIGASTVWPIKQNIDGLAAWNYNISHEHFQNYLYGISYNTCCYDLRFALSKTFYAINGNGSIKFNTQFMVQFVLKGLGGVGQQKTFSNIANSIPGYKDTLNTEY